MKDILLILANLSLITCILLYVFNVVKKGVTPNPATFGVRGIIGVMNCYSYLLVVDKDIMKTSVALVSTISLVIVCLWALSRKQMTAIKKFDVYSIIFAVVIGIFWKTTGNPVVANLLLQILMFSSCLPAVVGVLDGRAKEKALPWFLATLCYVFMITAIALDFKNWMEMVHPVVSGLCGNAAIWIAVIWKNKTT